MLVVVAIHETFNPSKLTGVLSLFTRMCAYIHAHPLHAHACTHTLTHTHTHTHTRTTHTHYTHTHWHTLTHTHTHTLHPPHTHTSTQTLPWCAVSRWGLYLAVLCPGGKSAVVTGLVVGLGGHASTTNRGSKIRSFVKTGKQ